MVATTQAASVPRMVRAGLDRVLRAQCGAQRMPADTHAARARKLTRVAELFEREQRWWNVLSHWARQRDGLFSTSADVEVTVVFARAAGDAAHRAGSFADSYREMAADAWQRSLAVASDSGVAV